MRIRLGYCSSMMMRAIQLEIREQSVSSAPLRIEQVLSGFNARVRHSLPRRKASEHDFEDD